MRKKSFEKLAIVLLFVIIAGIVFGICLIIKDKTYSDKDFGIKTLVSSKDKDNDGIDDYADILQGARAYLKNKPPYKSKYYIGGYPTDKYAVCTDLIWYSMKNAGYDLKNAVDYDIEANKEIYLNKNVSPDPNIDFRRVRNLKKFFERNSENLTLDTKDINEWQGGDIVTFSESHIAIVSDKRNKNGIPYILHQSPHKKVEADLLTHYTIDGHFRITGDYKYGK